MSDRDRLVALLRERSLEFGDFVLASGARSNFYIDVRRTTMSAEGQALVGRLGLTAIRAEGLLPDAVGGLTMGADPAAYAIAHASWIAGDPVNAFSVRKQAKGHGKGRRIEGTFETGQKVVVIEDTVTSGGSALEAAAAVEEEGGEVLAVLTVVDRESGGREKIEAAGYPLVALVGIGELLETAEDGTAG